jgi:DNA-binding transcriptional regulator YhcF (GntR family)/transposase
MKSAANQIQRQQIITFFLGHDSDRKVTRNHFKQHGLNMRTIDRALEQYRKTGSVEYKQSSGRIPVVGTAKNAAKLKRRLIKNPSLSGRTAGRGLQISEHSVRKLKKQLGVVTRTKQSAPLYKKSQAERAKRGCKKLYKQLVHSGGEKFVIMDDETYVPCDSSQIPGKEFWNDIPGVEIPADFKIKRKDKFPAKFLVWQAISQDGLISDAYVTKCTLNGHRYLNDIIKGPLLKFLRSQKDKGTILFWPDLASSHYHQDVISFLKREKIQFVPKIDNPPNLPQCRPIEKFWALCKMEYHRRRKNLTNPTAFKREWTRVSKLVASKHGKSLFFHFKRNLRLVGEHGPDAIL